MKVPKICVYGSMAIRLARGSGNARRHRSLEIRYPSNHMPMTTPAQPKFQYNSPGEVIPVEVVEAPSFMLKPISLVNHSPRLTRGLSLQNARGITAHVK